MTKQRVVSIKKNKKMSIPKVGGSKTKRIKVPRNLPSTEKLIENVEVDRYALALMDPFNPNSEGAKVPDQFCLPTTVRTIRTTQTATIGAVGSFIGIVTNNPIMAIAVNTGTLSDTTPLTAHNGSVMGGYWGVSPASFGSQMDNYRVVGMGVRVTGLSSMTNAAGKFVIGTFPASSWAYAKEFTVGGTIQQDYASATPAATWKDWGLPYNGAVANPNLLVNYPGNRVISAMEITENVFEVVPRMSDPEALIFRPTNDSSVGPWYQYSGASASVGNADYLKLKGFETTFIYVSGAPVGSTFDIEVIYHLEGRPNISAGTPGSVMPVASVSPSPVAPKKFFEILTEAAKQPTVRQVVEDVAGFIHPMLGHIAGTLMHLF